MRDEVFLIPAVVAATAFKLFAQSGTPTIDPGMGSLIGNLGIMGVLVWHLWYHTTHSYPKMIDKFATEQEKARVLFQTEQRELRESNAREQNELRNMLIQTMSAMRTAVHDVKDTANTAITKATLTEERAKMYGAQRQSPDPDKSES